MTVTDMPPIETDPGTTQMLGEEPLPYMPAPERAEDQADEQAAASSSATAPADDPEAPYGRTLSGRPKKGPGGRRPSHTQRTSRSTGSRGRSGTVPPPPRRPSSSGKPKGEPSTHERYSKSLLDWLMFPAGASVAMAAKCQMTGDQPNAVAFLADAAVWTQNSPPLADELATLAMDHPGTWFANAVEKIATVSPYAQVTKLVLTVGFQLAANHGLMPAGMMGTKPPEQLAQWMITRAEREAEQAAP